MAGNVDPEEVEIKHHSSGMGRMDDCWEVTHGGSTTAYIESKYLAEQVVRLLKGEPLEDSLVRVPTEGS